MCLRGLPRPSRLRVTRDLTPSLVADSMSLHQQRRVRMCSVYAGPVSPGRIWRAVSGHSSRGGLLPVTPGAVAPARLGHVARARPPVDVCSITPKGKKFLDNPVSETANNRIEAVQERVETTRESVEKIANSLSDFEVELLSLFEGNQHLTLTEVLKRFPQIDGKELDIQLNNSSTKDCLRVALAPEHLKKYLDGTTY
jgi:hypothetical protein